jgi:hypothetical protein
VISVMMVRRLIQKLLVWDGFMLKHKWQIRLPILYEK